MAEDRIINLNTGVLAYMGDAVYEVQIRKMLVERAGGTQDPDRLHHEAVKYVSAAGQAKVVKALLSEHEKAEGAAGTGHRFALTDEEARLIKRARNHRISSHPRHSDPKEYKLATGLEALFGYLFLDGQPERMNAAADEAVRILDEQ